jgi:ferredoxin-NADP reductase
MSSSHRRQRFYIELVEKKRVSETLMHFVFHATQRFDFLPGQFVSLRKPRVEGGLGRPRCYSLAGRAQESRDAGLLELCVALREKLGPAEQKNSFPAYLSSLNIGQRIECTGPFGSFVWNDAALEQARRLHPRLERICWIGTGSGIAPLRSMILSGAGPSSGALKKYVLLQGARNREQLIYGPEFRAIAGLEYYPCLSREPTAGPEFFQGRVTDQLRALAREWDFTRTLFMVCGSHSLVTDVRRILVQEYHTPESQIFSEGFGDSSEERQAA